MANFVLNAQAREAALQGKGASRRLRHAAQIPAIENVKIQALQRHPAKNTPMHADFKRA